MNKNEKPVARSLHNQQVRTAHRRRVPDQTPSRSHSSRMLTTSIVRATQANFHPHGWATGPCELIDRVVSETWFSTDHHLMPKVQLSPERLP